MKKTINLNIDELDKMQDFSKAKLPKFKQAAKKVAKGMVEHFKKDGWDLSYSQYVEEVFYEATGHHLEHYLINALKGQKLVIKFGGPHGLVFSKLTKKGKKK